ncbi:heterokaryon incompatibility protein-domain-containing protein [Halenospora varia]|nr:heterokaryon incompatibility protein-domain-containing protein [Halenospora varia]
MDSSQYSVYSFLDPTRHEIRILTLYCGSFSSALECSLSLTTLTTPDSYEALSYTWGTHYSSRPILVNNRELKITTNLEIALRHLRREDKNRVLWVDAICINQAKDATEERNHQVQKMRLIYGKAQRVIAWLGPAVEGDELVVDLVKDLKSHGISQDAVEASLRNPTESLRWKALFELCKKDYWSRVWTVQEIACASLVTLKFGDYEIDWEDIGWIGKRYSDDSGISSLPPEMWNTKLYGVCVRHSLRVLVMNGEQPPLLGLLDMTRRYSCSQPRDRVFGVLGLCKDIPEAAFAFAYGLPTADTFLQVAQFVIKTSGKLNIIGQKEVKPNPYRPPLWAPSELNLPSWVPDWSTEPGIIWFHSSYNGYRAVGHSKATPTFSSDGRTVTVEGCHLGDIEDVGEPYFGIGTPHFQFSTEMKRVIGSWLVLALNCNSPISGGASIEILEEERINAFCKTLIGNRSGTNRSVDQELYHKMLDVARGASTVPTESTGNAEDAFQKLIQPNVVEWSDMMFNRRFFTSGHAIMGMSWHTARVGDSIVILAGCDVPVILRKADGDAWEFHGESYVHGFMDAEVVDLLQAGKLKLKQFSIR